MKMSVRKLKPKSSRDLHLDKDLIKWYDEPLKLDLSLWASLQNVEEIVPIPKNKRKRASAT